MLKVMISIAPATVHSVIDRSELSDTILHAWRAASAGIEPEIQRQNARRPAHTDLWRTGLRAHGATTMGTSVELNLVPNFPIRTDPMITFTFMKKTRIPAATQPTRRDPPLATVHAASRAVSMVPILGHAETGLSTSKSCKCLLEGHVLAWALHGNVYVLGLELGSKFLEEMTIVALIKVLAINGKRMPDSRPFCADTVAYGLWQYIMLGLLIIVRFEIYWGLNGRSYASTSATMTMVMSPFVCGVWGGEHRALH
ncbi:hypothetical protein VNO77_23001 [Canavalia gladiata]|uniref:Uncharacterized protein n=1 Tax=Canavalia gladiata TaxID=3824 RepID=A0AAN9L3T3_CANGL